MSLSVRILLSDIRAATHGRPVVVVLLALYLVVLPGLLAFTAAASLFHRSDLSREIHRNCQRSEAIADYIHDVVPAKARNQHPLARPVARILKLEQELRAIGNCSK